MTKPTLHAAARHVISVATDNFYKIPKAVQDAVVGLEDAVKRHSLKARKSGKSQVNGGRPATIDKPRILDLHAQGRSVSEIRGETGASETSIRNTIRGSR